MPASFPPDTLIAETSATCSPAISPATDTATSLPVWAGGHARFNSLDGPRTGPSGQVRVLVNHSARQAAAWFWLIVQCRPDIIVGEQVDKAAAWLDLVLTDLESEDYTCGPSVLPAASVGAPHGRHRLWFVADTNRTLSGDRELQHRGGFVQPAEDAIAGCGLGDSDDTRPQGRPLLPERAGERIIGAPGMAGFWSGADWIYCRDGKYRPVESGTFPLAHGVSNRVGRLRAYGNAIVPEVAAAFLRAYLEN